MRRKESKDLGQDPPKSPGTTSLSSSKEESMSTASTASVKKKNLLGSVRVPSSVKARVGNVNMSWMRRGKSKPRGEPDLKTPSGASPGHVHMSIPSTPLEASPRLSQQFDFLPAERSPRPVKLSDIISNFKQWRAHGKQDVERLQARIDDMWLDEVMLGCDAELYDRIREVAVALEAGGDSQTAQAQVRAALSETEVLALQSVGTRLDARDCVRLQGGSEGLEQRVRQLRAKAAQVVEPYMEMMKDPKGSTDVRLAMERLLTEAQQEYASLNAMKTAKAEVVIELQDKDAEQDWMSRQLEISLELLEALELGRSASPEDVEFFFLEALGNCSVQEPGLYQRAVKCLRLLKEWGKAAAGALARFDGQDSTEMNAADQSDVPEKGSVARGDGAPGFKNSQSVADSSLYATSSSDGARGPSSSGTDQVILDGVAGAIACNDLGGDGAASSGAACGSSCAGGASSSSAAAGGGAAGGNGGAGGCRTAAAIAVSAAAACAGSDCGAGSGDGGCAGGGCGAGAGVFGVGAGASDRGKLSLARSADQVGAGAVDVNDGAGDGDCGGGAGGGADGGGAASGSAKDDDGKTLAVDNQSLKQVGFRVQNAADFSESEDEDLSLELPDLSGCAGGGGGDDGGDDGGCNSAVVDSRPEAPKFGE
eukprot:TRINITY_DN4390_c0_g2_i1.p1 TRINITY_DN4390_c0_g2~~TRINITY_DN4390_c0_g2_i1.p1  ORF type:complete len:652 (-),score=206.77 TRINITY_DN4390_c0_g2_i1:5-1960(-)